MQLLRFEVQMATGNGSASAENACTSLCECPRLGRKKPLLVLAHIPNWGERVLDKNVNGVPKEKKVKMLNSFSCYA